MWFLLRTCAGAVVLALAAYGLFFVEMGGQPLYGHIRDVWGSTVVQEKVDLLREGMRNELEDRLARVVEEGARKGLAGGREELGDEDRQQLERTLEQLAGAGPDHATEHLP